MDPLESLTDIDRFWLDTASGGRVNLASPRPGDISAEDVASALAQTCRFGGHASEYFSVAQHALLVEQLVSSWGRPDLALEALHHDSHEAFTCDLPSPLKKLLAAAGDFTAYATLSRNFDMAIGKALGVRRRLKKEDRALIKRADSVAFALEATRLLRGGGDQAIADRTDYVVELTATECPEPLGPANAREAFLRRHRELTAERETSCHPVSAQMTGKHATAR